MPQEEPAEAAASAEGEEGLARTAFWTSFVALGLTGFALYLSRSAELQRALLGNPLSLVGFIGMPAAVVGLRFGFVGLKSSAKRQALVGILLSAVSLTIWAVIVGN